MIREIAAGLGPALLFPALLFAQVRTPPSREEEATLDTGSGVLHGTLLRPEANGPLPVALIIAGSGPTDRNGNSPALQGRNDSLKLLAEALAANGIASLRYDKRGIGASGPMTHEADLRFGTYVDDAARWIRMLKGDKRFSKVVVIGHSEGSLIGMMAAREAGAAGFVSVAGAGRKAGDILRDQLRGKLPPPLDAESDSILAGLEAGKTHEPVPPQLFALYRPSVQPYMISWLPIDPAEELKRLEAPAIVVQGTTDIQVTVGDAKRLAEARPDARLVIIDGMNHVLKEVPADMAKQQASYGDPTLPVAPRLVEAIVSFVKGGK